MNKISLAIIGAGCILAIGIFFLAGSPREVSNAPSAPAQNVEVRDGVQYVTINARGGYSPRVSAAQARIPTKLIVKTNGTYDCSLALVIRSIGYKKILAQTGEEVIDLGTNEAGSTIDGTCSMGMYRFAVKFN